MRITEGKLRQIIREELLSEIDIGEVEGICMTRGSTHVMNTCYIGGDEFHLKFSSESAQFSENTDPSLQILVEWLAYKIYALYPGIDIPSRIELVYDRKNKRVGIATSTVAGEAGYSLGNEALAAGLSAGVYVDVFLANWDIGNTSNIIVRADDERPVRIDPGGALTFRAKGAKKGEAFSDYPGELKTMLSGRSDAANIFRYSDLKVAARTFSRVPWERISAQLSSCNSEVRSKLEEYGLLDLLAQWEDEFKQIAGKLRNRHREILQNVNFIEPQNLEQVKQILTRQQKAYQDLRAAAKQNLEQLQAGDPARYAETSWERTAASNAAEKGDYPQGYGGIVPQFLSPGKWRAGKDILKVWEKNADQTFFKNEVKKVHWLGFSKSESSRTAVQSLQDFLVDAPLSKNVQISTVGYLEDLNPGPRAGTSFREGIEGTQVQVGIKLIGDATLATTHDAYTTNRGSIVKAQMIGARAGQVPPPAFEKVPRAELVRKYDLARKSHPMADPELIAAYDKEYDAATARAGQNPGTHPMDYMDPSWKSVIMATPETLASKGIPSLLMLDRQSWREPFTGDDLYNEVILDNWEPEAIILNPRSVTLDQIKQIKALADEAGLPLLDTNEQLISIEDFAQMDRAHTPMRAAASPKSKTVFSFFQDDGKGKAGPVERPTDDQILPMDDRARQYEGAQHRWGQLAGLLKG